MRTWRSCSRTTLRLVGEDRHRTEEQQWQLCTHCLDACVLIEAYPDKTRELWAYMALIVKEARRCGGNGWCEYDAMFHQQASSAAELEWRKLDGSLYTVTFLAHKSGRGRICKWYQEINQYSRECALGPADKVGSSVLPGVELKQTPARETRGQDWSRIYYSWIPPLTAGFNMCVQQSAAKRTTGPLNVQW